MSTFDVRECRNSPWRFGTPICGYGENDKPRSIATLGARLFLPRRKTIVNIEEIIDALEAEKRCLDQAIALIREGRINLQGVNDAIDELMPTRGRIEDKDIAQ